MGGKIKGERKDLLSFDQRSNFIFDERGCFNLCLENERGTKERKRKLKERKIFDKRSSKKDDFRSF